MKKISFLIIFSLFFSCNTPESFNWEPWVNSDADHSDEDTIDIDEDMLDEDSFEMEPDGDVADEEVTDDDVDDEETDDDEVADDVADEDETDNEVADEDTYINPCLPTNPCVEEHKTVCTDANLDGVEECACDPDYHLNNQNECRSNTKQAPCIDKAPENATSTVVDVDVTWNGTGWNTAADCAWTCDEGYKKNLAGDACEAIANPCVTPDPCNDLENAVDDSCDPALVPASNPVLYTGVFECGCDANYIWTVDQCVEDQFNF